MLEFSRNLITVKALSKSIINLEPIKCTSATILLHNGRTCIVELCMERKGLVGGNQGDERRTRDKYGTQHNRWHIALVALCSDVTVHDCIVFELLKKYLACKIKRKLHDR